MHRALYAAFLVGVTAYEGSFPVWTSVVNREDASSYIEEGNLYIRDLDKSPSANREVT